MQYTSYEFIDKEMESLERFIIRQLQRYFKQDSSKELDTQEPIWEDPNAYTGQYARFIKQHQLSTTDRLCMALCLAPLVKPQLLDAFHISNSATGQRFVEFGCTLDTHSLRLLPTFSTLLFLLAGANTAEQLHYHHYFAEHFLFQKKMIFPLPLDTDNSLEPNKLQLEKGLAYQLIYNKEYTLSFSTHFPARQLHSPRQWQDLVLPQHTLQQVEELKTWAELGSKMLQQWEMHSKVPQGYKALFYGPSGTGKTLTATLLGQHTNKAVYAIDLSMVVSKYIGETEKNLSGIFQEAEKHDWILFFDEADALFGKRTNVQNAHDRYANQEVSYLLQRLESYHGLVILSSNYKSNIDEAFARRFQSMIHFPMPHAEQRLQLWQNTFSQHTQLASNIDIREIAQKYTLSGGNIVNVVRYASLMAMKNNRHTIKREELIDGIAKEYEKRGESIRL